MALSHFSTSFQDDGISDKEAMMLIESSATSNKSIDHPAKEDILSMDEESSSSDPFGQKLFSFQ